MKSRDVSLPMDNNRLTKIKIEKNMNNSSNHKFHHISRAGIPGIVGRFPSGALLPIILLIMSPILDLKSNGGEFPAQL